MRQRLPIIVTDLDRTFTDRRLRPVPSALKAMADAQRRGYPTILATGRTLPELQRKRGLLDPFDYVIAEGGGLIGTPRRVRPFDHHVRRVEAFRLWLNDQGILHQPGVSSLSFARADLALVRRYPDIPLFQVTPNRNRVDATLRGVHKGSALDALRRLPRLRARTTIGFGDGENDFPLFEAVDRRVAVANAVPGLRRIAHDITRWEGGRGVADYLRRNLLGPEPALKTGTGMERAWTPPSSSKT